VRMLANFTSSATILCVFTHQTIDSPDPRHTLKAMSTNINIANVILDQMGGAGRIRCMTGAKQFIAIEKGLQFKFPNRQRSRGNFISVVLDADDTYTVTFRNHTAKASKIVREESGIYWDQLKELFENQTGLRLSL